MENRQALADYVPPQPSPDLVRPWPAGTTEAEDRPPFSIPQILGIQQAFWKISTLVFVVVLLLAAAISVLITKSYVATSTLMVHFNSLDPLAAKEFADNAQYSYLSTQMELLQGDAVLDRVIERLSLTSAKEFMSEGNETTRLGQIEAQLRKDLDIEQGRGGSQLIYVNASASTAQMAADIANAVVEAYLDIHDSGGGTSAAERVTRYGEGLDALKQKVDDAQKVITDLRARAGPINLDTTKGDIEFDQLATLERNLLDARNALRTNQAKNAGKQEATTSVLTSTSMATLRNEGNILAARMAQMRTEYGPNHPDVKALQSQIDSNKAEQAATQSAYASATNSDIAVTNSEIDSLEKAVTAQRAKVRQAQLYRDQAAKYQLELESAQQVYKKALDGYDQEKFAARGTTQYMSFAARARPPVRPSKPNPVKYMLVGFAAGVMLALATPFLLELPRRKIRCRDDLERDMQIPLLLELPNIPDTSLQASARA